MEFWRVFVLISSVICLCCAVEGAPVNQWSEHEGYVIANGWKASSSSSVGGLNIIQGLLFSGLVVAAVAVSAKSVKSVKKNGTQPTFAVNQELEDDLKRTHLVTEEYTQGKELEDDLESCASSEHSVCREEQFHLADSVHETALKTGDNTAPVKTFERNYPYISDYLEEESEYCDILGVSSPINSPTMSPTASKSFPVSQLSEAFVYKVRPMYTSSFRLQDCPPRLQIA
mmetsp:Transcript_3148/g.5531  ORF Transcript_3148/g.5531 Transcript_3148/m.5531 type:complete len:229 (-) Transcript_3148:2608-3294(-)